MLISWNKKEDTSSGGREGKENTSVDIRSMDLEVPTKLWKEKKNSSVSDTMNFIFKEEHDSQNGSGVTMYYLHP